MAYSFELNGLSVKTADIICTKDGGGPDIAGVFWRLIGMLIPGDVSHVVMYLGPGGRCVEAGPKGVISFETPSLWDSSRTYANRGFLDQLYGVAYPLSGRNLSVEQEEAVRQRVARYCLAQVGKPYNFNFLNSSTEDSFYCSQLAYRAYLKNSIDLNTGKGAPAIPGTSAIVFPRELWESCAHVRPPGVENP
ncbi:MAG: YiiX/YebB-like N1pC/P60 family cysteine hydrolase [Syntrophobacteraceae bacterium]|nr:YiiX/YebB-like N1pC/P60 family cysteine hydrolase [Syntrophobacteraceae bacterium]